jgi:signal transduction histidine kinase/DNA-binding NarL/FixJ family response regulator
MKSFKHRILLVDDTMSIHEDFRKILAPKQLGSERSLAAAEAALFGENITHVESDGYALESAYQGEEALKMVEHSLLDQRPYSLAFVDVRMPPGWDGIETVEQLWKADSSLQIVICTAYSDYSWEEISKRLPTGEKLLILKKPFDKTAVLQMVTSLTRRQELVIETREKLRAVERLVGQQTDELKATEIRLEQKSKAQLHTLETLAHSEELFSKSFYCSHLPMVIQKCVDNRYVEVNDSFLAMVSLRRGEVIGHTPADAGIIYELESSSDQISSKSPHDLPCHLKTIKGLALDVLISVEELTKSGEPHLLTSFQDVTMTQLLEKRVGQLEKMSTINNFSEGILQSYDNLHRVIELHAAKHLAQPDLPTPVRQSFLDITHTLENATMLTRKLQSLRSERKLHLAPINLNAVIKDQARLLSRLIGTRVKLQCFCDQELPLAQADPAAIAQILMNLAANSRDATPYGGLITILTNVVRIDEATAMEKGLLYRDFLKLSIADTGCGMNPQMLKLIFEPDYKTKLEAISVRGMTMINDLVREHFGWIEVQSEVGRGTIVHIVIPQAPVDISNQDKADGSDIKPAVQELIGQFND